jgi:hypothetical protein
MSKKQAYGGGSIILKVLILCLIVILGYSVFSPKMQWSKQNSDEVIARERMTNLESAALLYFYLNHNFPQDVEELLAAIDTSSMLVDPVMFEFEEKQNMLIRAEYQDVFESDAPDREAELIRLNGIMRDSLLVTLDDTLRIERFEYRNNGNQLVTVDEEEKNLYHLQVWAVVKDLYKGVGTDTLNLYSEEEINIIPRARGPLDRDIWVSTGGRFSKGADSSYFSPGELVMQPLKNYSFTLPLNELGNCPSNDHPVDFKHISKYSYKGEYLFEIDAEDGMELLSLAQKQIFLSQVKELVANPIGDRFTALTDSAKTAGDEEYKIEPGVAKVIIAEEVIKGIDKLKRRQKLLAEADFVITAGSDSIMYYTTEEIRLESLFSAYNPKSSFAQTAEILLADTSVVDLISRVRLTPAFEEVKVDTVGVAIYCPLSGEEQYLSGWQHIFEVSPAENHGEIYNNTESWE